MYSGLNCIVKIDVNSFNTLFPFTQYRLVSTYVFKQNIVFSVYCRKFEKVLNNVDLRASADHIQLCFWETRDDNVKMFSKNVVFKYLDIARGMTIVRNNF